MRSLRPSPRCPPLRSVTDKGKRLVLPRLDVPSAFLALLLCFSAALPAVAQEPTPPPAAAEAVAPSPADQTPTAAPRSQQAPPRPVADRRAEIPGRLHALRLGQSRRAEGRRHPRLRRGLVRQPQPVHGEGRPRGRHRHGLRLAAGLQPRRAVVRVRPHRRVGFLSARLFVGDLRPQSEGALPGRLADHAGGRHLLVRGAEEGASARGVLLQERRQGGEDRRQRGDLHLRRQRQPRAAADRRAAQRAVEEILGRHRPRRPAARHHEVDAGDPARLRRLSRQELRCRPLDHLRARQGLLGEGSAGHEGAVQLRRVQADLLPRPHAGVRGVQVRQARLLDREHRQPVGDGLQLPRHREGLGEEGSDPGEARGADAGVRLQPAPQAVRRIRACAAPSRWPSTSRKPTRSCSTISMSASAATSTIPSSPTRACRRAASWSCSTR